MSNHVQEPRHVIPSACCSVDDDPAAQSWNDWFLVANAVIQAAQIEFAVDAEMINVLPGDHYRLIGGLIRCLRPKKLVDIGTAQGISARVMCDVAPLEANVSTFDIIPWDNKEAFPKTYVTEDDFASKKLIQYTEDLKNPSVFQKYLPLLNSAEFIMLDGPKDGQFEWILARLMAENLKPAEKGARFLFIDDIRFENMLGLWRMIASPKIDLTSFGHFSGSGLVDITEGLDLVNITPS